jgi:hypothetical protein
MQLFSPMAKLALGRPLQWKDTDMRKQSRMRGLVKQSSRKVWTTE